MTILLFIGFQCMAISRCCEFFVNGRLNNNLTSSEQQ